MRFLKLIVVISVFYILFNFLKAKRGIDNYYLNQNSLFKLKVKFGILNNEFH